MPRFLSPPRIVVILAGAAALLIWAALPGPIVLDIPVKKHKGGGPFWSTTEVSVITHADGTGGTYVRRISGTAYPATLGWTSPEEVAAYFDGQMAARGWSTIARSNSLSLTETPETGRSVVEFVRVYERAGAEGKNPYARDAHARLSITPIPSVTVEGFNVSLTTFNPSFLKRVADGFD